MRFSQLHLLLPVCQEVCDQLTGEGRHSELGEKDFWDDGVECRAEVQKQDPYVHPWGVKLLENVVQSHVDCIIHRPVAGKLQGSSRGPVMSFMWVNISLSIDGCFLGTRMTVERLKQEGTSHSSSDLSKICVRPYSD